MVDKSNILRLLKGAPLSVMMALWLFGSMDRRLIIARTGWKKAAVDDALLVLVDYGLVVRHHYRRWALSDGFKQLDMFGSYPQLIHRNPESPKNGLSESESPKNGLSELPIVSSRSTILNKEVLGILNEFGIVGPKAAKMACMEHIVSGGRDYISAHVADCDDLALAIWRMCQGYKAPVKVKVVDLSNQIPERYKDVINR